MKKIISAISALFVFLLFLEEIHSAGLELIKFNIKYKTNVNVFFKECAKEVEDKKNFELNITYKIQPNSIEKRIADGMTNEVSVLMFLSNDIIKIYSTCIGKEEERILWHYNSGFISPDVVNKIKKDEVSAIVPHLDFCASCTVDNPAANEDRFIRIKNPDELKIYYLKALSSICMNSVKTNIYTDR